VIGKGTFEELYFAMKQKKRIFIIEENELREVRTLFIDPIKESKNDKIYATVKVVEYEEDETEEDKMNDEEAVEIEMEEIGENNEENEKKD
jgi:hypothetical protein